MPKSKRKQLQGRGVAGKVAVAGVKDRTSNQVRARVVGNTDSETLLGDVLNPARPSTIRRDEGLRGTQYPIVRGMAHTNGIESFWSM